MKELTMLRTRFTPSCKKKPLERHGSDPGERNTRLKTTCLGSKLHSSAGKSKRYLPSQQTVLRRARTRSPAQLPRFDPTAYVERKKKLQLKKNSSLMR